MGTSGYHPSDSDDAWDAFGTFETHAHTELLHSFGLGPKPKHPLRWVYHTRATDRAQSGFHWTAMGVLELHMRHGGALPVDAFKGVLKWLNGILQDNAWLEQWGEAKLIERSVKAYQTLFQAIVARLSKPFLKRRWRGRQRVITRVKREEFGWRTWPMKPSGPLSERGVADAAYAAFDVEMKKIGAASQRAQRKLLAASPKRKQIPRKA